MWRVIWSEKVEKALRKVPIHIALKFRAWALAVEEDGLPSVRKLPGFHDEPLRGTRQGQRSIRLNRAYRAIYVERPGGEVELVEVIEVNKHEY
jgi:proteic killer suppression protein